MSNHRLVAARSPVSRGLQKMIEQLRDDYSGYLLTYSALRLRRDSIAGPFMAGFRRWRQETGRSFIAYVREIDPSVPAEKAAYMQDASYQAALYLRRKIEAPETLSTGMRRTLSPYRLLTVVLKSCLPLVRPHEAAMWAEIDSASRWRDRDLARLRTDVKRARTIPLRPDTPRLVAVTGSRVSSVVSERAAAADR